MTQRRLQAPWSVERTAGSFRVVSANGIHLAYVYFGTPHPGYQSWQYLEEEEAHKVARAIARLPELMGPGST